jgi:hypothetical protein
MNSQTSRKIIVASGVAVVFGIAILLSALRWHPITSDPRPLQPPAPIGQIPPAAPTAASETLSAPAAVSRSRSGS